jgi:hypothetical protein
MPHLQGRNEDRVRYVTPLQAAHQEEDSTRMSSTCSSCCHLLDLRRIQHNLFLKNIEFTLGQISEIYFIFCLKHL